MKQNDPIRAKRAWIRFAAALLAAVVLLAVSGFGIFRMLGTPKSLLPSDPYALAAEGSGEDARASDTAQVGDFAEHEVYLILKNFAEGTRGDKVVERYGVVPVNGKLVAFCFPQRWLASEQAVVDSTQDLLNGVSYQIDNYIIVRGTLEPMSERVSAQLYSWFAENQEWMTQGGLIPETEDAAEALADYVVQVDRVGRLSMGWVVGLTIAAGVCLLYALYELIRILLKGYAPKAPSFDAGTISQEIREVDPATGKTLADEDLVVEITETDPESGEDVTDLEVEIVEEEPTDDAEA